MPSINKIRISNVTYSDGEKYYDDLTLNVEGKSFLIDYVNGGGKTFLAQCAMQTILPKSHFTPKHPFKELYKKENNNNTIHCLVEWKLESGNGYDYIITGFCSRKKENKVMSIIDNSDEKNTSDTFNYVCFYNEGSNYSIDKLPLKEINEAGAIVRKSYSALRKYLRELNSDEVKEHYFAQIFDTTIEYHKLLKDYKINATEWELLKDVNRDEAKLAQYFDKYTSAKVFIKDFLIPKIDEANKLNNIGEHQSGEDRAESLLAIKDAIIEYSKRIDSIKELDLIRYALESLTEIDRDLSTLYGSRDDIKIKIVEGFNKIKADIENQYEVLELIDADIEEVSLTSESMEAEKTSHQESKKELQNQISEIKEKIKQLNMFKDTIVIKNKELEKSNFKIDLSEIELTVKEKDIIHKDILFTEKEYYAENKFMNYLNEKAVLLEHEEMKKNYEKSHKELIEKLSLDGGKYKYLLSLENEKIEKLKNASDKSLEQIKDSIIEINKERDSLIKIKAITKTLVEGENTSIKKLNKDIEGLYSNIVETIARQENIKKSLCEQSLIFEETRNKLQISSDVNIDEIKDISEIILKSARYIKGFFALYIEKIIEDIFKVKKLKEDLDFVIKSESSVNDNIKEILFTVESINNIEMETKYKDFDIITIKNINNIIADFHEQNADIIRDISKDDVNIATKKEQQMNFKKEVNKYQEELVLKRKEFQEFKEEFDSIDILVQMHNTCSDVYELEEKLSDESKDKEYEILNLDKKLNQMTLELENLKKNKGIVLSDELMECFTMLEGKFESVLLGTEFLKTVPDTEKNSYLEKSNSLIAYAILVSNSDFNKIVSNDVILHDYKDSLIPIINIDSLKNDNFIIYEGVYLTHRSKTEILDEERIKRDIEGKEVKIEELSQNIELKMKYLDNINKDLIVARSFNRKYSRSFESEKSIEIKDISNNIEITYTTIADIIEEINKLEEDKQYLSNELESIKINIETLQGQLQSMEDFRKCISISSMVMVEVKSINKIIKEIIDNTNKNLNSRTNHLELIANYKNTIKTSDEKVKLSDVQINRQNRDIFALQEKSANYKADIKKLKEISNNLNFSKVELHNNISLVEAEKIYNRTLDDTKGKLSEISFIETAISRTKASMETMANEVKIYGFEFSFFENKNCEKHTEKEFSNLSENAKEAELELEKHRKIYKSKEKDIIEANAIIVSLIKRLENKNKIKYTEIGLPDIDVENDIIENINTQEDKEYEIDNLSDKIDEIDKKIKEVIFEIQSLSKKRNIYNDKITELNNIKNSIENLILNESIDVNLTREIAENLEYISLRAKRELESNKKKIDQISGRHKDKVDMTKMKLSNSTFNFAEDLNDVLVPRNLEECQVQIEDILGDFGYIHLLEGEKKSLVGEMEELESYQESFVNLCIQRCNYALDKMLDIEEFSKVDINGEKISAIQVILNPLPEDEKKVKMRNYITNIINSVDGSTMDEDKLKEFGKLLELKNLFPQILTDINKCAIRIYKINETCDGGKYIYWGEAGSTGQTNSMFLYFFMCIIVFIRRLSSFNIKEDSRKLIILDSPFNGTVAINLWKIPLELMRKNNVQLMCLGYQVPSHLTGLFDVRYSLGETKMNNGVSYVGVVKEEVLSKRIDSIASQDIIYGKKVDEIVQDTIKKTME